MVYFSVRKKVTIKTESIRLTFLPPPSSNKNSSNLDSRIYCCTAAELVIIGQALESISRKDDIIILSEKKITSRSDFPPILGISNQGEWERNIYYSGLSPSINNEFLKLKKVDLVEQISNLDKKHARIAIINGVGTGIGDTLIGITALSIVNNVISEYLDPSFEIIYSPSQHKKLSPIFNNSNLVKEFHASPLTLKQLLSFDSIIDTGGMAHRPEFYEMPVIDYFLTIFGLDPELIENSIKRNKLKLDTIPEDLDEQLKKIRNNNPGKKLILLHPRTSSDLKNIPDKYVERIVSYLKACDKYVVLADEPIKTNNNSLITDISEYANSFANLSHLISQVDGILTADTCIYHIADCFNIPSVAWFTSYDPDIWTRYYPTVSGVLLDGAKELGFLNCYKFNQTDEHLMEIKNLWDNMDIKKSLSLLDNL